MDLLKLLPILFVAAQGDARAIHQQLLPAIPGYVPVYIQQGPDVEVIYEAGRKVAIHDSEKPAKPVEEEQPQKVKEVVTSEVGGPVQEGSQDVTKEVESPVQEVAGPSQEEARPLEPAKVAQDSKSTHEDESSVLEDGTKMVGSGSAVLVPGYQASVI